MPVELFFYDVVDEVLGLPLDNVIADPVKLGPHTFIGQPLVEVGGQTSV